jgi:hypothetical protein
LHSIKADKTKKLLANQRKTEEAPDPMEDFEVGSFG